MTSKKHFMFLLLVGIVAVITMGSVSAVTGDKYVNATGGSDTNDGNSWEKAYQTIQKGLDNVIDGGTVNIAAGVYTGPKNTNLNVNKNVTINGAGKDKTIIDPRGNGRAFNINSGKNVTIQNVTIKRGSASNGGAIYNRGKLTVKNVKFTNNRATRGGAIYNTGTLTVTSSTFKDNRAFFGGAIWSSGTNTATITGSTFRDNIARYGGAIYNTGTLTVTGSTFRDNIARYGGAIYNIFGTLSIKYSAIVDNWRNDIYMNRGTLDARYNWWGTNFRGKNNPLSTGRIRVSAFTMVPRASYTPWLILSINADPKTIYTFGSSKITADLYTDSAGGNHKVNTALYPAEIPIRFTTDLGSIGSRTVNTFLVSGIASVTLKANYRTGKAHITAKVDDQLVRIAVTIRRAMDPGWGYIQCPHIGIYTQCCREHQQPPNTLPV